MSYLLSDPKQGGSGEPFLEKSFHPPCLSPEPLSRLSAILCLETPNQAVAHIQHISTPDSHSRGSKFYRVIGNWKLNFTWGKYRVTLVTSRAMSHSTLSWHPQLPPVPFLTALFSSRFLITGPVPVPSWSQWQTSCWLWGRRVHSLIKWEHTQGITQRVTEPSWLRPPQDVVLLKNTKQSWACCSVLF